MITPVSDEWLAKLAVGWFPEDSSPYAHAITALIAEVRALRVVADAAVPAFGRGGEWTDESAECMRAALRDAGRMP